MVSYLHQRKKGGNEMEERKDRSVQKAAALLKKHEKALRRELGKSADDLLTPKQVADELSTIVPHLGDLVRQGWLAPAPDKDVGHAHQYYRWRVEFVKRYRTTYKKAARSEGENAA
jgi:hypothetical protein